MPGPGFSLSADAAAGAAVTAPSPAGSSVSLAGPASECYGSGKRLNFWLH